jgi:transposase
MGRGGITQISRITGVSRVTITLGMKEIEKNNGKIPDNQRCRKEGGGRKSVKENYPEIKSEIEKLLAPYTKGDPMNPLKYSSKSARNIEKTLLEQGYKISDTTIMELLKEYGCSLQANRKELAMRKNHVDRDRQFEYINKKAIQYSKVSPFYQ